MLSGRNFQLLAGLVAIAAAAIWRNTLLTIGVGFAALFLLRAFA
jgi:branched-subunit amino acid transport protein